MAGATVYVTDATDQALRDCDVVLAGPDTNTGDVPAARMAWLAGSSRIDAVPPVVMVAQVAAAVRPRMHTTPR
jgi:hypothetical protein